jgi:transposase
MQYIQGSVDKKCDSYLDELQQSLKENCGVEASLQTVWRALKRKGYSMKKVRSTTIVLAIEIICETSA